MKLTKIGTILVASTILTGLGISTAAAAENEPLPPELGAAPTVAASSATTKQSDVERVAREQQQ